MRLLFLLFLCCIIGLPVMSNEQPEELFSIEWGAEDSAFRMRRGETRDTFGPVTFAICDRGNFYFPDRLHECIRVFNPAGKQIKTIPVDIILTHFTVDENDCIYSRSHRGIISIFCPDREFRGASHRLQLPYSRDFVEGYGREIFVKHYPENREKIVYIYTLSGKAQSVFTISPSRTIVNDNQKYRKGIAANDGYHYQAKWAAPEHGTITVFDGNNTAVKQIDIRLPEGRLGTFLFKGLDKDGNIIVELERIVDGYAHLEVWQVNREGKVLQKMEFPNNYRTTVYQKTYYHEGTVYQMFTRRGGFQINFWKVAP